MSQLIPVQNVKCVMCGRLTGALIGGRFLARPGAPQPIVSGRGSRCGNCGGNLYLEPDEPITPVRAEQLIAERIAAQTMAA